MGNLCTTEDSPGMTATWLWTAPWASEPLEPVEPQLQGAKTIQHQHTAWTAWMVSTASSVSTSRVPLRQARFGAKGPLGSGLGGFLGGLGFQGPGHPGHPGHNFPGFSHRKLDQRVPCHPSGPAALAAWDPVTSPWSASGRPTRVVSSAVRVPTDLLPEDVQPFPSPVSHAAAPTSHGIPAHRSIPSGGFQTSQ